jgi:hypothetical protein
MIEGKGLGLEVLHHGGGYVSVSVSLSRISAVLRRAPERAVTPFDAVVVPMERRAIESAGANRCARMLV